MHIVKETLHEEATKFLMGIKNLRKRAKRDECASSEIAVQVACSSAIDLGIDSCYIIPGNSYGYLVMNVYADLKDGLSRNPCKPKKAYRVTAEREVFVVEVAY